ncbi:Aste57867_2862 [Aphanomyces stellatus]|uniref:Aste57867_2862 protein n=1 Tax=Aphanomyces stellatus TaxID=120398 RepID=A0A485K8J3_9STRA|nr:hypothetical protein As57867_002854 [Aphanomyces stellatus]VFT80049.1 Aste57867_2862 [Aphanomyces stellatus]
MAMSSLGKRVAVGSGLLLASAGGTAALVEMTIRNTQDTAAKERATWETAWRPLKDEAAEKLPRAASAEEIRRLREVIARVDAVEKDWRRHEDDVAAMTQSWTEAKEAIARRLGL